MRLQRCIVVAALVCFALAGRAFAIADIDVVPARVNAAGPAATASTVVTWRISAAPGPARTITSRAGRFILDEGRGTILLTTGPLSVATAMSSPPAPAVLSENVEIPNSIIEVALERGVRRILYVRTFEATYTVVEMNALGLPVNRHARTSAEAAVVIDLQGATAGPISVYRTLVRFDDGSSVRVLGQRSPLRAYADLSYTGGGTIQGAWELADAATSAGSPIFVELVRVYRTLGAGQRITLESPPLPTNQTGLHMLRFRLDEPRSAIEAPVIRYHVARTSPSGDVRVVVVGPPSGALVTPTTRFQWDLVPGAVAYRLEIVDPGGPSGERRFSEEGQQFRDVRGSGAEADAYEGGPAVAGIATPDAGPKAAAGVLVAPDTNESSLTPLALARLEPGATYAWRLRALAADGSTVGISTPRSIRIPQASPQEPATAP